MRALSVRSGFSLFFLLLHSLAAIVALPSSFCHSALTDEQRGLSTNLALISSQVGFPMPISRFLQAEGTRRLHD